MMRRGDVYLVNLDPAQGGEANKRRPAVIVSNDATNRVSERNGRGVVTVVPLTSNTARVYPFQALVTVGESGLSLDSKAQAEQVRSVDVTRLVHRVGRLAPAARARVDAALRIHLDLQ
jgi:mRNA interferase MazF